MTDPNHLEWLQWWYATQCDGEWEHSYGVTIETLDNPGWSVKIDLKGTALEPIQMAPIKVNSGDENARDWMHCSVSDGQFLGFCDSRKLGKLIEVFRSWAEANVKTL